MIDKGGVLKLELRTRKIFDSDLTVDGWMNPGNYLELIVADTGHGMDKLTLSHIFDPYFTTKDEGEGTGLGLSVVHGIIRKIGGGIKVYSEPNVGTEFRILLPTVDREK
jgi:signal transduction histidine kinase